MGARERYPDEPRLVRGSAVDQLNGVLGSPVVLVQLLGVARCITKLAIAVDAVLVRRVRVDLGPTLQLDGAVERK